MGVLRVAWQHSLQQFAGAGALLPLAGVKPRFVEWDGKGSPVEWVISENLIRRHLTSSQRAVIALDLLPLLEKELGKGRP